MYVEQYQLGIAIGVILIAMAGIGLFAYNSGKKNAGKVAINVFRDCFTRALDAPIVDEPQYKYESNLYTRFASQVGIKLKITRHLYKDGKLKHDEKKSSNRNRPRTKRRNRVVNIVNKL